MSDVLIARQALPAGPSAHHARIDVLFSRFDLTNRDEYERFLTIQASAYLPIESALDRSGAAAVVPDWANRRRSHLLVADLPATFLAATNPGGWRSFVLLLDRMLRTPEQILIATAAATRVFRSFEYAANGQAVQGG